MAEKKINLAIMTYQNLKGQWVTGQSGETVQVHDDDVERFDELNDVSGLSASEAFAAQVANTPAGPTPTQTGITHDQEDADARAERDAAEPELSAVEDEEEDELLDEPRASAPKAEWQAYAEQEGVELDHADGTSKTKQELIDELSEDVEE